MPGHNLGRCMDILESDGSTDGVYQWSASARRGNIQRLPHATHRKCSALVKVWLRKCQHGDCPRRRGGAVLSLTFAGLQLSQTWTGTPFFALLTRPVMGVSLMGMLGAF